MTEAARAGNTTILARSADAAAVASWVVLAIGAAVSLSKTDLIPGTFTAGVAGAASVLAGLLGSVLALALGTLARRRGAVVPGYWLAAALILIFAIVGACTAGALSFLINAHGPIM